MDPKRVLSTMVWASVSAFLPLGLLGWESGDAWQARMMSQARTCQCSLEVTRTLATGDVRICAPIGVALTVRTTCTPRPFHIVFLINQIHVPEGSAQMRQFGEAVLDGLEMSNNPHVKAAVVWMDEDSASIKKQLTNRESEVKNLLNPSIHVNEGRQCFSCGFSKALAALADGRDEEPRLKAVVYIGTFPAQGPGTLGERDDWIRGTGQVKGAGATMVLGCPWLVSCRGALGWPWERYVSPGYFFDSFQERRLGKALGDLVDKSLARASGVQVDEQIPSDMIYFADSAHPRPSQVDPRRGWLRWDFAAPITRTITVTYRLQPLRLATIAFTGGSAVVTDTQKPVNLSRSIPIPPSSITVSEPCLLPSATPSPEPTTKPAPTATDTPTPSLTPTITSSPIATATPTAATPTTAPTATASPTATPTPAALYLPLLLREQCVPDIRRVDVVLAIDTSSSMTERSPTGRTKLAAAIDAARIFLDQLRFDRGDQAAIVAFNASATLLQPLTGDRAALEQALAGVQTAQQTCLVCAVDTGWGELGSTRHAANHAAVLVLLTDGRSNPRPAVEAVARAGEAKAAGVTLFTIGLGADLDSEALGAIASRPGYFHRAPDGEALAEIYRQIAVALPCAAGAFWGGR